MGCTAIQTGTHFLTSALSHLDCQGQAIGAYGYGALAAPGSVAIQAASALLALAVALFGLRMLLGVHEGGRDVIGLALRVGIMLTLATSWPAYRAVVYDLVLDAPGDVARTLARGAGLPGGGAAFGAADGWAARVQNIDDGMVAVTMYGSGRLTGGAAAGKDLGGSFGGIALDDQAGLGWGRVVYLVSILGPYAITRLGAGLLLALTPIMAGCLLFGPALGLFAGWARGLVFCMLGAVGLQLLSSVEVVIFSPWLEEVMADRGAGLYTPSVPTEMIVLALAFAVGIAGWLRLCGQLAFHTLAGGGWAAGHYGQALSSFIARAHRADAPNAPSPAPPPVLLPAPDAQAAPRARALADAIGATMRREAQGAGAPGDARISATLITAPHSSTPSSPVAPPGFGESHRRTRTRASASGQKRDLQP